MSFQNKELVDAYHSILVSTANILSDLSVDAAPSGLTPNYTYAGASTSLSSNIDKLNRNIVLFQDNLDLMSSNLEDTKNFLLIQKRIQQQQSNNINPIINNLNNLSSQLNDNNLRNVINSHAHKAGTDTIPSQSKRPSISVQNNLTPNPQDILNAMNSSFNLNQKLNDANDQLNPLMYNNNSNDDDMIISFDALTNIENMVPDNP
ncbi:uncharacterized protein ASCRUDRAFT_70997 [Ascoidea rubescens DSM 1968]|uniref:Uncharacterized protein n=1 Tax=Ascoidea rubescens DSM 1968 TaxID=1344418 RepID=A0A1D2VG96_9ASCO|nr:hypothetical protein ASCRUDRAFT_70997 [Ascoidea rubescens DSM 1968]ODV60497.1 hypothetical protein ASCRUDRAFT_70997 [Ascoidea rubescens DSM 1968]